MLSNRAAIECRLEHPEYTGVKIQIECAGLLFSETVEEPEKSSREEAGQGDIASYANTVSRP